MTLPFNPLDMDNLGKSIVTRLEECPPHRLADIPKALIGAGVYAIYYRGEFASYSIGSPSSPPHFPAYESLAEANSDGCILPIYVGKAVPKGGRRGLEQLDHTTTAALRDRLREHRNSLQAVDNLNIEDFEVRWLVVEDIWIPLGESAMIRRYQPVWNAVLDGFGNHAQGSGRDKQERSLWDTLHPGRSFAMKLKPRTKSAQEIGQEVAEYIRSCPE